jgi:P63C domain
MLTNSGRALGGVARAESLTKDQRSEIAKKAANSRWGAPKVPDAVCGSADKPLRIGETNIECYVLADGTRVITQASFLQALGRHRKASVKQTEDRIPAILQVRALSQFLTGEILEQARPVSFRPPTGGRANGYQAQLLPVVCELYLKARDAGVLDRQQAHIAVQSEILMRGLAHVGIVALVDEATGYQEMRGKEALTQILEAFVAKEIQAWVKTFPEDYYKQLFRLRGMQYPDSPKRPQFFGHLTNDIVYSRLAPGVLDELRRVTPRTETGKTKAKLFQSLTTNMGYPKLREHLGSVVTIMKLSDEWSDFKAKIDRLHPRYGQTVQLALDFDTSDDGVGL